MFYCIMVIRFFVFGIILLSFILSFVLSSDDLNQNESLLLLFLLNGNFLLVDRWTGRVLWQHESDFTTSCEYSGGFVLVPEPQSGRLYEYSNSPGNDIIYRVNGSIVDLISNSPEMLNSLYSAGYKSDHWLYFDLDSGRVLKSTSCPAAHKCFTSQNNHNDNKDDEKENINLPPEPSKSIPKKILAVGISKYNFILWDLASASVKFNMTYQTIASHAEPDFQSSSNLTHLATLQPSLVTFQGTKFLWRLPVSSPIIDLFTLHTHLPKPSVSRSLTLKELTKSGSPTNLDVIPKRLHRIIFTTYALNFENATPISPENESDLWESKFNNPVGFVQALFIGESVKTPIYAIHTVSERTLFLRPTRRVSKHLLLESSEDTLMRHLQEDFENFSSDVAAWEGSGREEEARYDGKLWPKSVPGLYILSSESPRVNPAWSPKRKYFSSSGSRLFRLTDLSTHFDPIILPGSNYSIRLIADTFTSTPHGPLLSAWTILFVSIACPLVIFAICFGLTNVFRDNREKIGNSSALLNPLFDYADDDGWAGHSNGDPYNGVRFNTRAVLGSGANGTCVFEGFYGSQRVAVKQIRRRPQSEKSWLREHRILMQHHHEYLIRCFWAGSSPNFHYLVLQRCSENLLQILSKDGSSLIQFGLSSVQAVSQLLSAIVFLHQKSIVHRDIKPSNIFLLEAASPSSDGRKCHRLVLGDFGLSLPLQDDGLVTNSISVNLQALQGTSKTNPDLLLTVGSLGWMAPELCKEGVQGTYTSLTTAVDVFAFGLVAYFIFTGGRHPFHRDVDVLENGDIHRGHLRTLFASFARLHDIQKAINDHQKPPLSVEIILEKRSENDLLDKSKAILAHQMIEEALVLDSRERPSIEVVAASPLFWSAGTVMSFFTELSNFLDEPKPKHQSFSSRSAVVLDTTDGGIPTLEESTQTKRWAMIKVIDQHASLVFSGSWLRYLDPILVNDLQLVRSYQENSVVHLLRAVRNKRNHIWTLNAPVRQLLGESDEAMATYWNSRFPSLLPLLVILARSMRLVDVKQFRRFWPTTATHDLSVSTAADLMRLCCKPQMTPRWKRLDTPSDGQISSSTSTPANPAVLAVFSSVVVRETQSTALNNQSGSIRRSDDSPEKIQPKKKVRHHRKKTLS